MRARNAESLRTRSSTGASPSAPLRCASAFQISITRPVKADNGLRNNGLRIVLVFLHDQVRAAICFGAVFSLICEHRRLRGVVAKEEAAAVCEQLNLQTVPFSEQRGVPETIDEILQIAEGKSVLNNATERQGLVWVAGSGQDRISFKTISNKFLARGGE